MRADLSLRLSHLGYAVPRQTLISESDVELKQRAERVSLRLFLYTHTQPSPSAAMPRVRLSRSDGAWCCEAGARWTHLMSRAQPPGPSFRSMHGIGYGDLAIRTDWPPFKRQISLPSTDSSAGDRAKGEICTSGLFSTLCTRTYLQLDHAVARENDSAEAERARRDGCEQESVYLGVRDGSAG